MSRKPDFRAIIRDESKYAGQDGGRPFAVVLAHERDLMGELVGEEPVVRIQEAQELAPSHFETPLTRGAASAIRIEPFEPEPGLGKVMKCVPSAIGRAIVDNDGFPVLV